MHVFHLFMDHWMSFGDRERSDRALLAELWRVFPPQPSELALPAARRRVFFCLSRRSSEIYSRAVDKCYNLALVAVRRVKDAG